MTALPLTLTVLAILVYAAFAANVLTLRESDAFGRGLSQAFAMIATWVLWPLLAALLLVVGKRGALEAIGRVAGPLLLPLSFFAALKSIDLLADMNETSARWLYAIPVGVPPLIIGYAIWSLVPGMRGLIPAGIANAVGWGGCLALSVLPWPRAVAQIQRHQRQIQLSAVTMEAEHKKEMAEKRERSAAKFDSLPDTAPLWEWLSFLDDSTFRDRALEKIRRLDRRQADAETMLGRGFGLVMAELPQLGLQATDSICRAGRHFMDQRFASVPAGTETPPLASTVLGDRIEPYVDAVTWLIEEGCDLDPVLAEFESAVPRFAESPHRTHLAAALAEARKTRKR